MLFLGHSAPDKGRLRGGDGRSPRGAGPGAYNSLGRLPEAATRRPQTKRQRSDTAEKRLAPGISGGISPWLLIDNGPIHCDGINLIKDAQSKIRTSSVMKNLPIIALVAGLVASAHAWAAGPSFDCNQAKSYSERLLCVDPDLADKELAFVQAYYALRYQTGEAGWPGLKREILDFERASLVQCNLPDSGPLPLDMTPLASCLADAYTKQRSAWIARLSGPAAEEARRSPDQNVALQRDLQVLGLLPSTARIDGVYGAGTRAAVVAWQQSRGVAGTGFLGDGDAGVLQQQGKQSAEPPDPQDPPLTANLGMISYGSKEGEAPIVMKKGISTSSASISALVGWNEYVRQCDAQYDADNKQGRDSCLAYWKSEYKGPKRLTATANCETGEFVDTNGRHLTFAGERQQKSGDNTYVVPVLIYEGFEVPDYGYTDIHMSGAQFKAMCPAGRPLEEERPELDLPSCDDQGFAKQASTTAFSSGLSHVMNVTVIDVWDAKGVESTWNEVQCRAKITLSTGRDMVLYYSAFPRHGKLFISARAE
jgi:hypothetical protein